LEFRFSVQVSPGLPIILIESIFNRNNCFSKKKRNKSQKSCFNK
jgi:hypothetical protein